MNGNFKNLTPPTTRPSMRHSAAPQPLSAPKLAPTKNAAMAAHFRYKSDQKLVFSYAHCRTQLRTGRTPAAPSSYGTAAPYRGPAAAQIRKGYSMAPHQRPSRVAGAVVVGAGWDV